MIDNKKKQFFWIGFIFLMSGFSLNSCSFSGGKGTIEPCRYEEDCLEGETCVDGVCLISCILDSDCPRAVEECHNGGCREVTSPECTSADNCTSPGICYAEENSDCYGGRCHYRPELSGVACDDGDPCTINTTCDGEGNCQGTLHEDCIEPPARTIVTISENAFLINGRPTYEGISWGGHRIEGLLMNSRMVQGIFDDLNPETVSKWVYPDTDEWDADRNTDEFIAAMPEWLEHGLLSFTLNLQGGSPEGYSQAQPWHNSAFESDGSLRADYMDRLERILDRADELGMVVILGYFYFGQDERLEDESAVIEAVDNATQWILDREYRNVLIEINNECNVRYDHDILKPSRVHELIERVQNTMENDYRLLVSTSYGGGRIPDESVAAVSDFLLLHGNGVSDPNDIAAMVRQTRALTNYANQPILFNEDDHYDFDKQWNNFTAAISEYASWGYFDFRRSGEDYDEGFQSVPVNWGISSERKRDFFDLLNTITAGDGGAAYQLTQPIIEPNLVLEEREGLAAVEAEYFFKQTNTEKRAWYITSSEHTPHVIPDHDPPHVSEASRGTYIEVLPDTRVTHDDPLIHGVNFSEIPGELAVLHYRVYFNNPGRYYVWVRAYSTGTEDNGIHVGINGEWPSSGRRMQWCVGKDSWRWESMQRTQEQHCGVPHSIYLDVPTEGEHEITFSMREDGFEFDKFILTTNPDFARPSGAGPEPYVRQGTLP